MYNLPQRTFIILTNLGAPKTQLATTVSQPRVRLPQQLCVPPNTGLQRHRSARVFSRHRRQPANTHGRGRSDALRGHLLWLHLSTIRALPIVTLHTQDFRRISICGILGMQMQSSSDLCEDFAPLIGKHSRDK